MFVPIFDSRGRRGGFVMTAPALSPRHGGNPVFRVSKLRNGIVMDYDQFYGDIVENPKEEVEWKLVTGIFHSLISCFWCVAAELITIQYGFAAFTTSRKAACEIIIPGADTIMPCEMYQKQQMLQEKVPAQK
jgi:hypothetical protein